MKPDARHIRQIKIVSNTHWDREFRKSFEKTRRRLLTMLDVTLDVLDGDPKFHSFTMDGHSIMIDDYLEMRPERRELVERLVCSGRLVIGPWYTLAEEFSISHEPIVRNLLWGRKRLVQYGAKPGTVAYTPASWGQTGQLPQILAGFGLARMMFYRGISHHECDAEFIWEAPDGTRVLGSRFALYARYNWYYQVHRAVTRNRVFGKDYVWGEYDEAPVRFADGLAGPDPSFEVMDPAVSYDRRRLRKSIEDMLAVEGPHFTTEVFLAMNGHDISVAFPLESKIVDDAAKIMKNRCSVEHTDLESYWNELEKHLDRRRLPVLKGERRSYLKQGMWTYLMPATISARSYLKQQDFAATVKLVNCAEPLASLAAALGAPYPVRYLERGWTYLLSNHTHDANGGCAPDAVCLDIEYRYRKASDIGDIVAEDAINHIAGHLSPRNQPADVVQLVVVNPLPFARDVIMELDLEVPRNPGARSVEFESAVDRSPALQPISSGRSSAFVDNIWDVPTILDTNHLRLYAEFRGLPALGYRAYTMRPKATELRAATTLVTGPTTMDNEFLRVEVNGNGTVNVLNKRTGKTYRNLNHFSDQGECGNAWNHRAPTNDRKYNSLGLSAKIAVCQSGPLVSTMVAELKFPVPRDYADGTGRSDVMVELPLRVEYRIEKGSPCLGVTVDMDNDAKDHWLRANFPTGLGTDLTWADSHFDVVSRAIPLPDSTGWVEPAEGTHPLRTFVDMSDGQDGLAILPKGIFEYEAFEDEQRTLALTLIRACRIKLAVSEEKQAELPDQGVQCPGAHRFEYALCFHRGSWQQGDLLNRAARFFVPVRAAMCGRGRGNLPHECSLFAIDNSTVHVTCVKQAEDGLGMIVRLFNPLGKAQKVGFSFGRKVVRVAQCRVDESEIGIVKVTGKGFVDRVGAKNVATYRVQLAAR